MKFPPIHYYDYLQLNKLLDAQKLRSAEFKDPVHDEMLFITVHQAYELWFKQVLFEIDSVMAVFKKGKVEEHEMGLGIARLERVIEIQKMMMGHIDVLETMTPMDFLEFRDFLYPASGFQSHQWKILETKLGLKQDDRLVYNNEQFFKALKPSQEKEVIAALESPTLFDLIEGWLERTPFIKTEYFDFWTEYQKAVNKMFNADLSVAQSNPRLNPPEKQKTIEMITSAKLTFEKLFNEKSYLDLQAQGVFRLKYQAIHAALFILNYRDLPALQLPYRLLSCLITIDEKMTEWRYRHALMVHRMLGKKIGTGGSSGHDYLKAATEKHKVFSDLFNLSTFLIPRSEIPKLPDSLKKSMHYQFES